MSTDRDRDRYTGHMRAPQALAHDLEPSLTAGYYEAIWHLLPQGGRLTRRWFDGVFAKWFFVGLETGLIDPHSLQLTLLRCRSEGSARSPLGPGTSLNQLISQRDLDYIGVHRPARLARPGPIQPIPIRLTGVTPDRLSLLRARYTGSDFNGDVRKLLALYQGLGGVNNHLSTPLRVKHLLASQGPTLELYGSPLNADLDYCSPFEFDRRFGSRGPAGTFDANGYRCLLVNPPFDETQLVDGIKHIEAILARSSSSMMALLVMPDWNPPYQAGDRAKQSRYTIAVQQAIVPYENRAMGFSVTPARSLLVLLSNGEPTLSLDQVVATWEA